MLSKKGDCLKMFKNANGKEGRKWLWMFGKVGLSMIVLKEM